MKFKLKLKTLRYCYDTPTSCPLGRDFRVSAIINESPELFQDLPGAPSIPNC